MSFSENQSVVSVLIESKKLSLNKLQGMLETNKSNRSDYLKTLIANTKKITLNKKTVILLTAVSEETKKTVIKSLEAVVSSALNTVYGEGHSFIILMENRRNQVEADFFIDDGNTCIQLKRPFVGKGGGKVTIAAFALQLAIIEYANITGPLFLDEITRYVDKDAVKRVALLLRDYSVNNNRQVINITHHDDVAETADIKYKIVKDKTGIAKAIRS